MKLRRQLNSLSLIYLSTLVVVLGCNSVSQFSGSPSKNQKKPTEKPATAPAPGTAPSGSENGSSTNGSAYQTPTIGSENSSGIVEDQPAIDPSNITGTFLVHTLVDDEKAIPYTMTLGCVVVRNEADLKSKITDDSFNYGCVLEGQYSPDKFQIAYEPQPTSADYHVKITITPLGTPTGSSARNDVLDVLKASSISATIADTNDPASSPAKVEGSTYVPDQATGLFPVPTASTPTNTAPQVSTPPPTDFGPQ